LPTKQRSTPPDLAPAVASGYQVALACGGTAGHIYPALAVADHFRRARGAATVFFVVPAESLACRLVAEQGYELEVLESLPLAGASARGKLAAVGRLARGIAGARQILRRRGAQLAVGFGGYASAAPLLAARSLGLVTAIHEANVSAGLTNRLLARLVDRVFTSFEPVAAGLSLARTELTGTPLRREIVELAAARSAAGARTPARILVTGGSLGSPFLNREAPGLLGRIARRGVALAVRHQCGSRPAPPIEEAYARAGVSASVVSYIDDMPGAYAWADFAIACAGAGTVFELAAAGLPTLFIPLAGAAHDHQTRNAATFSAACGGWWAAETRWQPDAWAARLAALLADPHELAAAGARVLRFPVPGAAEKVMAACDALMGAAAEFSRHPRARPRSRAIPKSRLEVPAPPRPLEAGAGAAEMKRVLLVQPSLQPPGGGNSVAVWMVEALKHQVELTILTFGEIDLAAINRYYGTALAAADFHSLRVPALGRALVAAMPTPATHFARCVLLRYAKRLYHDYDVIVTANNEANFGRRGIQYIHYPWWHFPRPEVDLRWFHVWPLLDLYYAFCAFVLGGKLAGLADNLTLVNSLWTGRKVAERHHIPTVLLYPPVTGDFPMVPWSEREDGFIALGRVSPEKKLEKVVAILAAVRERRPEVHLHIVGSVDGSPYGRRIRRLAAAEAAWVSLEENPTRGRIEDLLSRHRYGLHAMDNEHFGIAIAEMTRAGQIPFVPADGGQVEIVADGRLTYDADADAVAKILAVMDHPAIQADLRAHLAKRQPLWSKDTFVARIREIVETF
jgi:UDP-N-acetylglucosamine--N-acetylmuramyl-(pentapeptide) pyrophosphoryl-undecaprenol N-acetylglucosamine transferase